mgnify:CR=1 FL=1
MIYNINPAVDNSPLIAWDNLIPAATITATTGDETALLNGVTTDPWVPTAMPATVSIDAGAGVTASTFCIAAHNLGSVGATVTLERLVGAVWTQVQQITPADDSPLIMSFSPISAQEWRAVFSGATAPRVAVMSLGPGLIVPGRIIPPHIPLHRASEVNLVGDSESGTGEFLQADFERTGGRVSLNFSVQLPDFAAGDDFEAFRQHFNRGRSFFMACFPEHEPLDVGYLWRSKRGSNILAPYQDAVFMSFGIEASLYVG